MRFQGPSWSVNFDLLGSTLRSHGGNGVAGTQFPFEFDLAGLTSKTFGRTIWDTGNFNPNSYLTVGGKAADANLFDGIDSDRFLRKGIQNGQCNGTYLTSGSPPTIANIAASGNEDNVALTIGNEGNTAASCVIQFHRIGSHAAYFGLDTDNIFKVGGRSMGDNAYALWTDQLGYDKARTAQAQINGQVNGSYAFAKNISGSTVGYSGLLGGDQLRLSWAQGTGGNGLAGTWRCMGESPSSGITLWLRVS